MSDEMESKLAEGLPLRAEDPKTQSSGPYQVELVTSDSAKIATTDQFLWRKILNRTRAISFDELSTFIDRKFCDKEALDTKTACGEVVGNGTIGEPNHFVRVDAYQRLKTAVELFLTLRCGVYDPSQPEPDTSDVAYLGSAHTLPYLTARLQQLFPGRLDELLADSQEPLCGEILRHRYTCPCMIELIWSYWHEEGMLVQTMNAIARRFQNRGNGRDPMSKLTLAPVRPLSNLFWGYVQDEPNRLSVLRRAYEYDHEYGLRLIGKAVPDLTPADSRSKFLDAFHSLLHTTTLFYKQHDNKMIVADGFPVLNALKEVHLLLAEGAHNQFGDLPWTARVEMLVQQWLLSRAELREFLGARPMMPYREGWMGCVDTMKSMQGWTDVSVSHFHDLAECGEQILLSVRYGDWTNALVDGNNATNWAIAWRAQVQTYVHAYRAATGVDLVSSTTPELTQQRALQPSLLLSRRLPAPAIAR